MDESPSFSHLFHLIRELRRAAIENQDSAEKFDEGSFHYCLGAGLATDAANALEALMAERAANNAPSRSASACR